MISFHRNPDAEAEANTIAVFRDGNPLSAEDTGMVLQALNQLSELLADPVEDDDE